MKFVCKLCKKEKSHFCGDCDIHRVVNEKREWICEECLFSIIERWATGGMYKDVDLGVEA